MVDNFLRLNIFLALLITKVVHQIITKTVKFRVTFERATLKRGQQILTTKYSLYTRIFKLLTITFHKS